MVALARPLASSFEIKLEQRVILSALPSAQNSNDFAAPNYEAPSAVHNLAIPIEPPES